MRTSMVLGMALASAVLMAPVSGEAKSGGGNNGGTRVNHTSEVAKTKATSTGVKGPNIPKGKSGTVSTIKGESVDSKHKDEIEFGGVTVHPPPPPPPPPK